MRAMEIHKVGGPNVISKEDIPRPEPGENEVLVRVKAAGVGPWDALIRTGNSGIPQPLPLVLGSDVAGIVEAAGKSVKDLRPGEQVYGSTNARFIGGYADYAVADAGMVARKPANLSFVEAASVPVVAITAWQMLFDYGHASQGQTVLILGAAGNVGSYAVQMARNAGLQIFATAAAGDRDYVLKLGANTVLDYRTAALKASIPAVDLVIDTVGGKSRDEAFTVLKPEGLLVSSVEPVPEETQKRFDRKAVFFLVEVTTAGLNRMTDLFENGKIRTQVGSVLPLEDARKAHEMLGGAPHERGKIVLLVAA